MKIGYEVGSGGRKRGVVWPARLATSVLLSLAVFEGTAACGGDGDDRADPELIGQAAESGGVISLQAGEECPEGGGDFSAGSDTAEYAAAGITIEIDKMYTNVRPFVMCGPTYNEATGKYDGVNALMPQTSGIDYVIGGAAS